MKEFVKQKQASNWAIAKHLAENNGYDIPIETIIKIAKELKLKPNVLFRNYQKICAINKIFEKHFCLSKNN